MTLPPDTIDLWIAEARRNADSWTVRAILAEYLDVAADDVKIIRSPSGKPMLDAGVHGAASDGGPLLHYSVSHARRALLVAIAHRPLGIDIESTAGLDERPIDGVLRYLTANERATLEAVSDADRKRATLICWTRKEAYSKADGRGLSIGFDRFEVSAAPGSKPAIVRFDEEPAECGRWQLVEVPPIDGIVGTMAIDAATRPITRLREWAD